jgi:hypothetical protein
MAKKTNSKFMICLFQRNFEKALAKGTKMEMETAKNGKYYHLFL